MAGQTRLAIEGERFLLNDAPTYPGRTYRDWPIEGLLLNVRAVNAIFDALNPETRDRWSYPDTGRWEPERNVRELCEQLPVWREHGLLAVTVNLQGGSPEGYSKRQPWQNSGFTPVGTLRHDYLVRLERVLDTADRLGMVVILGLFYFGQDERLSDERAVTRAVDSTVEWLLDQDCANVIIEIDNECDVPRYEHEILQPHRVHELIERVRGISGAGGRRLLVSTSYRGGSIPSERVLAVADLALVHANGVTDPAVMAWLIEQTRRRLGTRRIPIVVNEDDHFDFDRPWNNMLAAISRYASWGFFDAGPGSGGAGARGDYVEGYQNVPVNWGINTPTKRAFFALLREITGCR
ncbi:MAG: hypothetical protein H0V51_12095 [Chloroflexi bacterium]|nr:hypothetical protein [Chloroflexota bacterium]